MFRVRRAINSVRPGDIASGGDRGQRSLYPARRQRGWETDWQVLAVKPGKLRFALSTSFGGNASNIAFIVAKIFFHAKYDRQSL
jgi:hypothetical protein